MLNVNEAYLGDGLELMKDIPTGSIDMILCDLPYGATECKWDMILPFDKLWEQYNRVIKKGGAIVLNASQPFTSALVMSNPKRYKHHWVWVKERGTGFQCAKFRPMMQTEDVIVFCGGNKGTFETYNPQMIPLDKPQIEKYAGTKSFSNHIGQMRTGARYATERYPTNIIHISRDNNNKIHPTQKPIALYEYLIKTYSNEGETVLDNCAGSMTTAIACINTNRKYICIEMDETYFTKGVERIKAKIAA